LLLRYYTVSTLPAQYAIINLLAKYMTDAGIHNWFLFQDHLKMAL